MDPAFAVVIAVPITCPVHPSTHGPVSQAYTLGLVLHAHGLADHAHQRPSADARRPSWIDDRSEHANRPRTRTPTLLLIAAPSHRPTAGRVDRDQGLALNLADAAGPRPLVVSSRKVQTEPTRPPGRHPGTSDPSGSSARAPAHARPLACAGTGGVGWSVGQFADQADRLGRYVVRGLDHQPFQRPAWRRSRRPGIAGPTARSAYSLPCGRPRRRVRAATVPKHASGWRCACRRVRARARQGEERLEAGMSLRTSQSVSA